MAVDARLGVAVVGCGLIGARRADEVVHNDGSKLIAVVDSNLEAAKRLGERLACETGEDWRSILQREDVEIMVIATPNGFSKEISCAALDAGKHVLVEKPMGRNLTEALQMRDAAVQANRNLKIGFNHRYHPAISRAHELFEAGKIGKLINLRARYGHGGRPGYEKEWRGNPELAGGGELTDQGVHVADLFHWFAGVPTEAFAMVQTAVWPLGQLEDNGFGLFRFQNAVVGSFHTSWTQWKNLFSLEIFGTLGSLCVQGLGKSYGTETLQIALRNPEGGVPNVEEIVFDEPDCSWRLEWADFMLGIKSGKQYLGSPADGIAAMSMLAALYDSTAKKASVSVPKLDSA